MSNKAADKFSEILDSHELVYEKLGDNEDVIRIGLPSETTDGRYFFFEFGDSEGDFSIKSFNVCKFPADKIDAMYKACSEVNYQYRWVKYYIDESDNTVSVSVDAQFNFDTLESIGLDLLFRANHITDDVYPTFMKALYC